MQAVLIKPLVSFESKFPGSSGNSILTCFGSERLYRVGRSVGRCVWLFGIPPGSLGTFGFWMVALVPGNIGSQESVDRSAARGQGNLPFLKFSSMLHYLHLRRQAM